MRNTFQNASIQPSSPLRIICGSDSVVYVLEVDNIVKWKKQDNGEYYQQTIVSLRSICAFAIDRETNDLLFLAGSKPELYKSTISNENEFEKVHSLLSTKTYPKAIAVDNNRNICILDASQNQILKLSNLDEKVSLTTVIDKHSGPHSLRHPTLLVAHPQKSDSLYLSDQNTIKHVDVNSKTVRIVATVEHPLQAMQFDKRGLLYAWDVKNNLRRLDLAENTNFRIPYHCDSPITCNSLAVHDWELFVCDTQNKSIWKMTLNLWHQERLLWIARCWEDPETCHLAQLPPELICEVVMWLRRFTRNS